MADQIVKLPGAGINQLYKDIGSNQFVPYVSDHSGHSATPNTPAIVTSNGTAIAANTSRKSWSIQNLDTDVLYVRLGGTASATAFHFLLKGGSVADDGLGGLVVDDAWTGLVSVFGTTPRFVVSELT